MSGNGLRAGVGAALILLVGIAGCAAGPAGESSPEAGGAIEARGAAPPTVRTIDARERRAERLPFVCPGIAEVVEADPMARWRIEPEVVLNQPEDSLTATLEVLTATPALGRPVHFRAEIRNHSGTGFTIHPSRPGGFELVVRNARGDLVGYAPPALPGPPGIGAPIHLCPGDRHAHEIEWSTARLIEGGRYTAELTLPTVEGLPWPRVRHPIASVQVVVGPMPDTGRVNHSVNDSPRR